MTSLQYNIMPHKSPVAILVGIPSLPRLLSIVPLWRPWWECGSFRHSTIGHRRPGAYGTLAAESCHSRGGNSCIEGLWEICNVSAYTYYSFPVIEYIPWISMNLCSACPDRKVHGANMGPTWVLSAPDGPHTGPRNLAIRVNTEPWNMFEYFQYHWFHRNTESFCIRSWNYQLLRDLTSVSLALQRSRRPKFEAIRDISYGIQKQLCP